MLSRSLVVARKDLRLCLAGSQGLAQTLLLGLLLIFVFSLTRRPGELIPPLSAAAIFWLATAFGQVLIFNTLYSLEEVSGARLGLALSPMPVQAVWLGKALAGLSLIMICQVVFAPAALAFLGQNSVAEPLLALGYILVIDIGLAALGSLLGALSGGHSSRESLLTVVLFPLLIPMLLSGIRLLEAAILGQPGESQAWLSTALAFDAVFTGASLLLFPFLYAGED